jgi:hypothetical protein
MYPDSHSYTQFSLYTMIVICLRDKLYRDAAPMPYPGFIYRDNCPTNYHNCTATAHACNKNCTMTAKSTPYLSCHRDYFSAKVPGSVAGWLRQVTQPPFIAGPLAVRAASALHRPLNKKIITTLFSYNR